MNIIINGEEFDITDPSDEAKAQLANIRFVDEQILQKNNEIQIAETAKIGYSRALLREIEKQKMSRIKLDDSEYDLSELSETANRLVIELRNLDAELQNKINMQAILNKAKNAYVADLKSEMITQKSGFDFLED